MPGTDEFITRCERVRAWNYVVRAEAQARLAPPIEPAGCAKFGSAEVWFSGERARVHLLDETCLDQLPAIEAWLGERKLDVLLDVLPIVACRPVTSALAERGYRLVAWQPLLYRPLTLLHLPLESDSDAVRVDEVRGEDAEFRATFLAGYEVPESELESAATAMEARWRAEGARRFIARIDGEAVAAATLVAFERIARLANCATLPRARGRGA